MFADQPIETSKSDLFGRKNFAQRLAEIVAARQSDESIVIALHAPWGEGKSSVLNMMVECLGEHLHKQDRTLLNGHIVLLRFNPWRFSDESGLLESFFMTLALKLKGRIKSKGEKLAELVRQYAVVASPLDAVKFNFFGLDANIKAEEAVKKLAELRPKADVEELKKRIEEILKRSDKKIVILLDDIDRLNKDEIQAVFRLVKLTADFPNTIYVLSFDLERVSEALAEKYGSKEAAQSFLEKIVQLSLPLPPLSTTDLINLTFNHINKLFAENGVEPPKAEDNDWSYFFVQTFGPLLKSPRLIKKYVNSLWFALPYAKLELNIFDLQTIEAVHIFLPDLYETIRRNRNVFLLEPDNPFMRKEEEARHLDKLREFEAHFPLHLKSTYKNILLKLFPRTEAAYGHTSYGRDWHSEWARNKRIASPEYFDRYFDFGVPQSDISDAEIERFIETLATQSEESNSDTIRKFVSNNRAELFLQKLSWIADDLDEETAIALAKAVAISGNLFPKGDQDSLLLAMTPFSDACRLLRQLLETLADETQLYRISEQLADIASPLDFAYEYFRFAKYIGREANANETELTPVGTHIIARIAERSVKEAAEEPLERRYPQRAAQLYQALWFEKREELKDWLKTRILNNPAEAEEFVLSFRSQNCDVGGIANLFGFDFVISALTALNPNVRLIPNLHHSDASRYLPDTPDAYLSYFVTLAATKLENEKKQKSEEKSDGVATAD